MKPHYKPRQNPDQTWFFTSPVGKHGDFPNQARCLDIARKKRKDHREQSAGDGAFAKILRDYFEPGETPIPDREYDFARDQEIIADYEATKR